MTLWRRRPSSPGAAANEGSLLADWLQERRYATAYHWTATRNRPREYALRTRVVLDLVESALARDGAADPGTGSAAGSTARRRLLDVGCGDALFLAAASRRFEAWGVDVSQRALRHASARVPGAQLLRGSADALAFASQSFDVVTLLDVIEHLPDGRDHAALDEAHRVLRPGGLLAISSNSDRSRVEWKHYRHYSLARFRALFDARFSAPRLVGLVPYFPGLRFLMQAPLVWPLFAPRVRRCAPDEGQVIVGVAARR